MKFDVSVFIENLLRKFKSHENLTRITGTAHEDQYTFFITSRSVLPRTRCVSDECCRGSRNTHFVISNFFRNIVPFLDNMEKKMLY